MNPWIVLQGGLPPVPGAGAMTVGGFFLSIVMTLVWAVVAAFAFGAAIPLAMLIFNQLTPGVDEFAELRRGNMAVAVVLGAFILGIAIIVAAVLLSN